MTSRSRTKFARSQRSLRHYLTARIALTAAYLVPKLSLSQVQSVGRFIGRRLLPIARSRVARIHDHLQLAMPELSEADRRRIARESLEASAMLFAEALWISAWRHEKHGHLVTDANPDRMDRVLELAKSRGKGLIIITAHVGPWEVLGAWLTQRIGMPILAVASAPNIPELADALLKIREAAGVKIVYRGDAGLSVMRHLRAGGCVVLLADHNLKGEGIEVPFFGQPAHSLLSIARVAVRSGAVAVTGFCYRRPNCGVEVVLDEPLTWRTDDRKAAERELTAEYTQRIEAGIRRDPGQWLWMHRRWRRRDSTIRDEPRDAE